MSATTSATTATTAAAPYTLSPLRCRGGSRFRE
jgi:hypothetical protein